MSDLPDLLRHLHRVLKQRTDLESRIARGPRQIAANEALVKRCEEELAQAKDRVIKAKMAADERQLQLKQREQRVDRLKGMLDGAANNKEYQTLQEQIAADLQANSVLADETFELLEAIDARVEEQKGSEAKLATARTEAEAIKKRVEVERSSLEADLQRVLAELSSVEAQLPGDLKTDYQRQVKAKGENCLAVVDGQTCGNCYQTLSPQLLNTLALKRTAPCGGCGSFLYLPERGA